MNDLSGIKNIQDRATVEEYRKALVSGNVNLAHNIEVANPDLARMAILYLHFEPIDKVVG